MKLLKLVFFLIVVSPSVSCAQDVSVRAEIQSITSGGLYYEYYEHANDKVRPTIVFESGALHASEYWSDVIGAISKHANTIRYDRAGLGRSLPSTDTIRSAGIIAKELNELLDSLKVEERITLVCHSAGGFYGRAFSHQFSDRVKALVLIESPCTRWEALLRSSITERQNEERDANLEQLRQGLTVYQRREYRASELNRKILDRLPKTQIPTFIIFGSDHQWPEAYDAELLEKKWKECQESLSDISSNSRITVVEGGGHHIFRELDLAKLLINIEAELK